MAATTFSRRNALAMASVFALVSDPVGFARAQSRGTTDPDQFAREPPKDAVQIGPLVAGRYEIAFQENVARALQLLGLPADFISTLLTDDKRQFSYVVDGQTLTMRDSWLGNQRLELAQRMQVTVSGITFADYQLYFDQPDRLICSFVSPNNRRLWCVRRFGKAGVVDSITIDGVDGFVATRVWKRLPTPGPGIPGISLM
jgi:hypothetical protein